MKQFIYFLFCVCFISCGNHKEKKSENIQEVSKLSIVKTHPSFEAVKPIFEKEVENWQELKAVNSFLKKFEKVSPNEALTNALELRDLVKNLKDSVKPKIFDIPSFNARVNVLHNETLRLADLTLIFAITPEEINLQIGKILSAFSSINSKINTILSKKRFEDAIDIKLEYIGIDSTKIDSISKNAIDKKRKEDLLKNKNLNNSPPIRNKTNKKNKR